MQYSKMTFIVAHKQQMEFKLQLSFDPYVKC